MDADWVSALDAAFDDGRLARGAATVTTILRTAHDADGLQPLRAEPAAASSSHTGAHTAPGCMPT
ncbi:hypothetical protein DLJ58_20970 [Micromonospora arida]|uniref:Uncharacterized protein n=1 Tax=Micromonospora arida TaxID=2203715 RepID=A0A3N9X3B3_9ACTN|nr:hypothetical protein DLJ58_20970 [Micromonospora arida]